MSAEPTPSSTALAAERRPAVWPWLLIPLVALTIFYVLHTAKESPRRGGPQHAQSSDLSGPSEEAESR
jgi:hypothetical protein